VVVVLVAVTLQIKEHLGTILYFQVLPRLAVAVVAVTLLEMV
jgi:hypothetical protein